jgi:hypothetical protein
MLEDQASKPEVTAMIFRKKASIFSHLPCSGGERGIYDGFAAVGLAAPTQLI